MVLKNIFKKLIYLHSERKHKKNLFKKKFNKKVLISYIVFPYYINNNNHSNSLEMKTIAKLFHDLGFTVDIIHYTNSKKINYSKYNVIFGFGNPFENSFSHNSSELIRIYYATGAHVFHQNPAEVNRVSQFNKKYNCKLLPKRLTPWTWTLSTSFSDYLIVLGNKWTVSTYARYTFKPIYSLNATALFNKSFKYGELDIEKVKTSFLWFGSSGLIHKGLDLCLDFFSSKPDLTLHICGIYESDFFLVMKSYLDCENIHFHGFIDVMSDKFLEITSQCLFSILPTCSEGQSTSLLTTMSVGLIPVASRYTGLDIENLGFLLNKIDIESLENEVEKISSSTNSYLALKSHESYLYAIKKHNLDFYYSELSEILNEILLK
jgi:hypothetical protein